MTSARHESVLLGLVQQKFIYRPMVFLPVLDFADNLARGMVAQLRLTKPALQGFRTCQPYHHVGGPERANFRRFDSIIEQRTVLLGKNLQSIFTEVNWLRSACSPWVLI